jgi:PAS domain S-box-containing protein
MINKHEIYIKAAESAKIGIWKKNLETNILYCDFITKQILEVSEDYIPKIENGNIFFNVKNWGKIRLLIKKAIELKKPTNGKVQVITANNNIKHLECVCLVEFKNNMVSQIFGTFKDITDELNLVTELESSVEKFSSIFSSANDAILIIDSASGIISDCNYRSFELTGYNTCELLGIHNSKLFPVFKRNEIGFFLENQVKNNSYLVKETYIKTKNKKIIPVEVASGRKFTVDNQTYLVCFFRDISERKKVEENLNMLSLVASETTDTIVITDSNGKAIWANKAYIKLTGLSIDEILGNKPGHLSKGPDTDLETINKIRLAIKNKEGIKVVILNYNKQKEKYWFELNITPVFDDQDNCIKFIGIGRDVTASKEKEIELQRILEVTSQQNNKLLNFAHIVSHNIRSQTSNLMMVLDVMENTENTVEKLSYVEMFKEGTEKLSETIEYLNEIITIQKNTNLKKSTIYLKAEIEKTMKALNNSISKSNIQITHTIPDNLIVKAIPAYLDNILINLLTNAIKYKSHEREASLEIGYEIGEHYTAITFKDNGLGINLNKNRHKIFGMYKTFHGNEDAKGIGLFLIKNQIEAMKGKIEIESEEGIGTIFKVYFNEK